MTAIYRRELNAYFKSLTGYVFGAFMLLFTGIYCSVINLKSGYASFQYVLSNASFIYIIIIPILTMRSVAEERRQKTDQLLYALPINMVRIVLGKYLALLTVLALPLAVICFYPLALSAFGRINYAAAYGAILGFFFLGAALLAIGLFISSLTESQAVAAGLSFVVVLLNYFLSSLSNYVSSGAGVSLLCLAAAIILLGFLLRFLTKNSSFSLGLTVVLLIVLAVLYSVYNDSFKGLFPLLMRQLSVFDRFNTFTQGIFDINALVYMITVCGVFVFFTVQALEKRRFS
jgi:ABC-2 type transport system permease protein